MTRWGFAGTGRISNDFALVLKSLPISDNVITAVAARSQDAAEKFLKKFDLEKTAKAYGSYEDLAKDANVDIVYIGTVHVSHAPLSILMMNHGKAVLCEKPMAMSYKDACSVVECAKQNKVLFTEGIWSRFFPVYDRLRQELSSETIGSVRELSVDFGVKLDWEMRERIYLKELGGGVMLDIGCYPIQLAVLVFGCEYPETITATGTIDEKLGVDKTVDVQLTYKDGRTANLRMSGVEKFANAAKIVGSKGTIEIPENFYSPTKIVTPTGVLDHALPEVEGKMEYSRSRGLRFEAGAVGAGWKGGCLEMGQMRMEESLVIARIVEEILRQLGVKYGV